MYELIEETPIADIKVEESDDLDYIQGRKEALEGTAMGHTYRISHEPHFNEWGIFLFLRSRAAVFFYVNPWGCKK